MDNIKSLNQGEDNVAWDSIIKSENAAFSINLAALWQYRDLLLMFVKRDFISFYKQTVLGPIWFFLQPVFTTIVYAFIFGNLAHISVDELPPYLFYLSGITAWNYFSDCLVKTSTVFRDNAQLFGKVYFPRLIMPLSIVVSNLLKFGVQLILMFCMMIYFWLNGGNFHITYGIIFFPVLVLNMALLGLGSGLIITALTTKYRDLAFLVAFGVQLLMYATTVIYPLSAAPEQYKKIIQLNPMTSIIEAFRFSFLGKGEFSGWSIGYTCVFSILLLLTGIFIFNKTERNFVDTV